ncbi:TIGR04255 family protein [uncultured Oscillibacter sp.]|uniref:TIGR04255 family protein n=1 Tax=uncultured Oscillibacter sp. TaxID=876091 RepID=UPI0025F864DB|nr:TIGR04255 family protein [uncultured Oscillibacter sp.]
MLFSKHPRTAYANAPAHEVICQLRFPAILTINDNAPAEFQEAIREDFPQFARTEEAAPPQITGLGGPNPQLRQQKPVTNYRFISTDNLWKLNLTQNFIALSTLRYTGWEEFAAELDKPLAEFIRIYKPAYFERVGLRYVNIISREKLGLAGRPWPELIAPAYLGALGEPDVRPENVLNSAVDFQCKLDSSCAAKIHAGPGRLRSRPNTPQDPEVKFILDMDLSMGGQVACNLSAAGLETLHAHATELFEGAVTDALREAMQPE